MDAIFLGVQGVAGIADDMIIFGANWDVIIASVADPGFPVGGDAEPLGGGGAPTSDVGTFQWKCMWKWKNWIPLEGGRLPGSANVLSSYL